MAITRLNHAVLYVRDVDTSVAFYRDALDFKVVNQFGGGAFLQAGGSTNDHDLAVFGIGAQAGPSDAGHSTVGLYHLAWEVDTLAELAAFEARLSARGALVGASDHSTTKSLYGRDPDGIEFEVCWIVPASFVDDAMLAARGVQPLDIPKEMARFGEETRGGVGISV